MRSIIALFTITSILLMSFSVGIAQQKSKSNVSIISPPESLQLDPFYQKYVNANGIHIISSRKVPDEALYKAYEIILFMTNGLPKVVLDEMVKVDTRAAIMARYEGTTDIPEHAHLENDTSLNWDVRARGLGGTVELPLTSCAEENLLCYQIDKYHAEDILIHEFAHTIHAVGILPVREDFNAILQDLLDNAISDGKYNNTYAATNIWEYWAEGVQNWFDVNAEVPAPDGKHNAVNTRKEMQKYDIDLYHLIGEYFPETETSPSCHAKENKYVIH